MHIDELIETYLYLTKSSPSIQKLSDRKQKALTTINQDIFFRDIIVSTKDMNSLGESKNQTSQYLQPTKDRLNGHISSLFNVANEDHRANYCEKDFGGNFRLKPGKENHITRLAMSEFSLYISKPLSLMEYTALNNDILAMAATLEPNVHILLSSFSVTDKQGQIVNMSIYVEGGEPPKMHSFSKNTASIVDVDYGNKSQLFTQQKIGSTTSKVDAITTDSGDNIYTGSVFEVQTVGGAVYTQTIDVCLDHVLGHSKDQINRRISSTVAPDEIIPKQIEQCVTSAWVDLSVNSMIGDKVLHADPIRSMHYNYNATLGGKTLNEDAKKRIVSSDFPQMSIMDNDSGYKVLNPPFGADYYIEVLAERPAGKYLPLHSKWR